MAVTQARMQQRYDTAANWVSANPVLLSGEFGIESDTNKFKIGDGSSTWTALDYTVVPPPSIEAADDVDFNSLPLADGTSLVYNNNAWRLGPILGPRDPSTDDYFTQTVLLAHFDGVPGSSTFVDSSLVNCSMFALNGAALSDVRTKYGPTSFRGSLVGVDNVNKIVQIPSSFNTNFDLGSGDFTIETYVNIANNTKQQDTIVTCLGVLSSIYYGFEFSLEYGRPRFTARQGTTSPTSISLGGNAISTLYRVNNNQWHHVAVTREGPTLTLWKDGIPAASTSISGVVRPPHPNNGMYIGGIITTGSLNYGSCNGYLDDLRITKGVARYTGSGYTVPTIPWPESSTVSPRIIYTIGGHSDVDTTSAPPLGGQGLFWNSVQQKWQPEHFLASKMNSNTPPISATDTGSPGDIRYDANYIYLCVSTDTWVRSPLSSW